MPAKRELRVTPSSGNVFRDLGFSAHEAEHLSTEVAGFLSAVHAA